MEPIHVSRLFDISAGLGTKLEAAARIVQGRTLTILKKAKDDFRSVIDAGTPSFYIIDIEKDIVMPIMEDYPQINKAVLIPRLEASLRNTAFDTSYEQFKKTITSAYTNAETSLNRLTSTSATHLQYRDVFRNLGNDIAKAFKSLDPKDSRAITRISDPASMGHSGKEVFIGKSFDLVQKNLNKAINTTIAEYLGIDKFSYGKYMSAGHTAVQLGASEYGTNTPATQEALFKLEMASRGQSFNFDKFKFQDDFVKQVPLFLQHSVDMTKDFSFGKILLDINFTFVVPMPASANSASGSVERKAIENLTSSVLMPSLVDAMKSRLAWLKEVAVNLRSSDSISDFIDNTFDEIFRTGKSNRKLQQTKKSKGSRRIGSAVVPNLGTPNIPKNITGNVLSGKVSSPATANKTSSIDLTSLLSYINARIRQTIKENMGDGNRKDILNYRSGRFASSVNVERLSISRQGMITAFYSYMRNPYATFSEGGLQSLPKTRDPKALISNSIREIAADKVSNRLRSVLV